MTVKDMPVSFYPVNPEAHTHKRFEGTSNSSDFRPLETTTKRENVRPVDVDRGEKKKRDEENAREPLPSTVGPS